MHKQRPHPRRVKLHRSYTVHELCELLKVHKNTVRGWQAKGLKPIDGLRPALFRGEDVRAFIQDQLSRRKQTCPPGMLFCFKCRAPRAPALGMADYTVTSPRNGLIAALCETCGCTMNRACSRRRIPEVLPGLAVTILDESAAHNLAATSPPKL